MLDSHWESWVIITILNKTHLTSLFSRTSCLGSCSISGASMSSAWTPSSGPCMGRGSRLYSTEYEKIYHHNQSTGTMGHFRGSWWHKKDITFVKLHTSYTCLVILFYFTYKYITYLTYFYYIQVCSVWSLLFIFAFRHIGSTPVACNVLYK